MQSKLSSVSDPALATTQDLFDFGASNFGAAALGTTGHILPFVSPGQPVRVDGDGKKIGRCQLDKVEKIWLEGSTWQINQQPVCVQGASLNGPCSIESQACKIVGNGPAQPLACASVRTSVCYGWAYEKDLNGGYSPKSNVSVKVADRTPYVNSGFETAPDSTDSAGYFEVPTFTVGSSTQSYSVVYTAPNGFFSMCKLNTSNILDKFAEASSPLVSVAGASPETGGLVVFPENDFVCSPIQGEAHPVAVNNTPPAPPVPPTGSFTPPSQPLPPTGQDDKGNMGQCFPTNGSQSHYCFGWTYRDYGLDYSLYGQSQRYVALNNISVDIYFWMLSQSSRPSSQDNTVPTNNDGYFSFGTSTLNNSLRTQRPVGFLTCGSDGPININYHDFFGNFQQTNGVYQIPALALKHEAQWMCNGPYPTVEISRATPQVWVTKEPNTYNDDPFVEFSNRTSSDPSFSPAKIYIRVAGAINGTKVCANFSATSTNFFVPGCESFNDYINFPTSDWSQAELGVKHYLGEPVVGLNDIFKTAGYYKFCAAKSQTQMACKVFKVYGN